MGLGSYLSRHVVKNVISVFIEVEMLIGLVGGCSAALLFTLFEVSAYFQFHPLFAYKRDRGPGGARNTPYHAGA